MNKHKDYFRYKSNVEIIISSDNRSIADIMDILKLKPDRSQNIGDIFISPSSGSTIVKKKTIWAKSSEVSTSKTEEVYHHIEYLKKMFDSKIDMLSQMKKSDDYDVTIWWWLETDNSGFNLELNEISINFIYSIANSFRCSFISLDEH